MLLRMEEPAEAALEIQPELAAKVDGLTSGMPDFVVQFAPNVVAFLISLLIFFVGSRLAKWSDKAALKAFRARKIDEALARFLASLVRWLVLAMSAVVALGTMGIETTSFVALLASAGLAVGLALQGSLSHFASGVMLLLFRPFSIGDVVNAGGQTGGVEDIGLFATTLKTPGGDTIIIPNASITGGVITNHTREGRRRADIGIGVAYGADLAKVSSVLEAAARSVEEVLDDPGVGVAVTGFGASSVDFVVLVWSTVPNYLPMQHKVKVALYNALNEAEIEIPFDQIVVHQAPAS